ncbi:MAG: alpha-glucosidase, partial [SAR324 cluster bacterium]|nr:alpha-glucosidase [SAR324 cluster bacterium]
GTPILYYGEELDMEEIILEREQIQDPLGIYFWPEHKGRDGCRTPFPWNSGEPNQGFNQGGEPWLSGTSPICLDQAEEMQESTLHLLREMLKIRKSELSLQSGSYRLHLLQKDCLIFQRETDQQSITVAANFSVVEQRLDHDFSNCSDLTPKIMNRRGRVDGTDLVLPPSGFFIAKH